MSDYATFKKLAKEAQHLADRLEDAATDYNNAVDEVSDLLATLRDKFKSEFDGVLEDSLLETVEQLVQAAEDACDWSIQVAVDEAIDPLADIEDAVTPEDLVKCMTVTEVARYLAAAEADARVYVTRGGDRYRVLEGRTSMDRRSVFLVVEDDSAIEFRIVGTE